MQTATAGMEAPSHTFLTDTITGDHHIIQMIAQLSSMDEPIVQYQPLVRSLVFQADLDQLCHLRGELYPGEGSARQDAHLVHQEGNMRNADQERLKNK